LAGEEIPRDFSAPELLSALKQLQAELVATRADLRTVAERTGATTGTDTAVAKEVQGTVGALNEEAAARERNVALAQAELEAQRLITAEIERSLMAASKLGEARGLSPTVSAFASARASETAAVERQASAAPPVVPVRAPAPAEAAVGAESSAAAAQSMTQFESYSAALTAASQRQVEFATAEREGGAANAEFVQGLMRGDVTLGEFGSQVATTAGKFAQWTAAAGGIFAVLGGVKMLYDGAKESASGAQQLQRSIDGLNTDKAQQEFRKMATELNLSIEEVHNAIFSMSRTFPNLDQASAAAGVALRALKVDNVSLTESVPALTAVHQQFGVTAEHLAGVFDMLDEGQRRYNGRVTNTLQVLGKSAAAVKDAGGSLEQLIQLSVYAARVTGQPGNQIGTAFYRGASNFVQQPASQNIIRNLGLNPHEASTEFTEFLIKAIQMSAGQSDRWKRELSIALGGKQWGGKVITPLLSGTDEKLKEEIFGGKLTMTSAKGSTQHELEHILLQPSEQIKAIRTNIEALGSAFSQSGAAAGFGLILLAVNDTLRATTSLVDLFGRIPQPLRTALAVLLEVKLALLAMQHTAIGAGLARMTGISALGPSPEQQASRAERMAQESSLAGVRSMQGQTLVREQQLRMQAAINEAQMRQLQEEEASAATEEDRLAIKQKINDLEQESIALTQQGNELLDQQAAQQEVANGLQQRINELRAGAQPAAGFFYPGGGAGSGGAGAAVEEGGMAVVGASMLSKLSSGLGEAMGLGMRGFMTGIMAQVGTQILGSTVGGSAGKEIEGASTAVGMGAGIGSMIAPGIGTAIGALGGVLYNRVSHDLNEGKSKETEATEAGFKSSVGTLMGHLQRQVTTAEAGELSPQALKNVQQTLAEMTRDPAYSTWRSKLEELHTQLGAVTAGTSEASRALAQANLFESFKGITAEKPEINKEKVANIGLKATTTGASKANINELTEYLDALSAQYGGGENKQGLLALQEAETKLLDSAKKNAEDLADKGKVETTVGGKLSAYKQGVGDLEASTSSIESGYHKLSQHLDEQRKVLKRLEATQAKELAGTGSLTGPPGSSQFGANPELTKKIEDLRKAIEGNEKGLHQIAKATQYESNKLKEASLQQAEAAYTDISNLIDAQAGVAEASTASKTTQLEDALRAANEKLKAAGDLFAKNTVDYQKALAEQLKAQQALVDQMVTDIGLQGKLQESQLRGKGPELDLSRAQIEVTTYQRQLAEVKSGKPDPEKVMELQTQINEAERNVAIYAYERSKALIDAKATVESSETFDAVRKAQIELRAAQESERGLSGLQLVQAKSTTAEKRATLYQTVTDEKIAALKYEHDVERISDQAYIESLQTILKTRKMAASTKRQLQEEIYKLAKGQTDNKIFDLAPSGIKIPTVYDVHRAIGEAMKRGASRDTSVVGAFHQSNQIVVYVNKNADARKVADVIDSVTKAGLKARLRKVGLG
jgi:hypothetical protein